MKKVSNMKVVQLFKIYNFDVVQKFIWSKIQELIFENIRGILNSRNFVFFNAISL